MLFYFLSIENDILGLFLYLKQPSVSNLRRNSHVCILQMYSAEQCYLHTVISGSWPTWQNQVAKLILFFCKTQCEVVDVIKAISSSIVSDSINRTYICIWVFVSGCITKTFASWSNYAYARFLESTNFLLNI